MKLAQSRAHMKCKSRQLVGSIRLVMQFRQAISSKAPVCNVFALGSGTVLLLVLAASGLVDWVSAYRAVR